MKAEVSSFHFPNL